MRELPKNLQRLQRDTFVAPVHTPFCVSTNEDGFCDVNFDVIPEIQKNVVAEGFNAVFISGTNGESYSCSVQERKQLVESWMKVDEVANKSLRVMVHISCQSTPESVELAKHAEAQGVHFVSWMVPCFFKP